MDLDDEHGEQAGEGAALVELATMARRIRLPFPPYPGLTLRIANAHLLVEQVVWDTSLRLFSCVAEPIWKQTRKGAEAIVESLVEAGFSPFDDHHREREIH